MLDTIAFVFSVLPSYNKLKRSLVRIVNAAWGIQNSFVITFIQEVEEAIMVRVYALSMLHAEYNKAFFHSLQEAVEDMCSLENCMNGVLPHWVGRSSV